MDTGQLILNKNCCSFLSSYRPYTYSSYPSLFSPFVHLFQKKEKTMRARVVGREMGKSGVVGEEDGLRRDEIGAKTRKFNSDGLPPTNHRGDVSLSLPFSFFFFFVLPK